MMEPKGTIIITVKVFWPSPAVPHGWCYVCLSQALVLFLPFPGAKVILGFLFSWLPLALLVLLPRPGAGAIFGWPPKTTRKDDNDDDVVGTPLWGKLVNDTAPEIAPKAQASKELYDPPMM